MGNMDKFNYTDRRTSRLAIKRVAKVPMQLQLGGGRSEQRIQLCACIDTFELRGISKKSKTKLRVRLGRLLKKIDFK